MWAAMIAAALNGAVRAEAPPCDVIKIISPYTAGGATDVLTRVTREPLGQALNRSFVLENRSSDGSNIGSSFVTKARPDAAPCWSIAPCSLPFPTATPI